MIPQRVHRYEIPAEQVIEALLGSAVGEGDGWRLRIEGDNLVVDIIEPVSNMPAAAPTLEAPLEPAAPATPKVEEERKGGQLAKKAGILCNERAFQVWAEVATPDAAKAFIYRRCGIGSRVDLDYEEEPARIFREMARDYDVWLSAPE
ncbi:MAG: hypothetical protein AB7S80_16725 [Rhizobiaceae bacterium]